MELRYQNEVCHLSSIHRKEKAIGLPFEKVLGCKVIPSPINTDLLGTFTGEIERTLSPFACVKEKCYRGLDLQKGTLGIASEGCFGPNPSAPFISTDFEILFFADRKLNFELTLTKISPETNFSAQSIDSIDALSTFANQTLFPSHALILRPEGINDPSLIYKGIQDHEQLYRLFQKCSEISVVRRVWVETDMRAHMNPTRMKRIEELAYEMATRLATPCPSCEIPGWGVVKNTPGLPCRECQLPTTCTKSKIYGCCQCNHRETLQNQEEVADPSHCLFCNP